MSRTFVQRCIILPLITALVIGVAVIVGVRVTVHRTELSSGGVTLMYHDALPPVNDTAKNRNELKPNILIGTLEGKDMIPLRYEADYANLADGASLLQEGRLPGETGTAYVKIGAQNTDKLANRLKYSGTFGDLTYTRREEKTVNSENAVFTLAPRAHSSLIVYCRQGENGLSSQYKVYIYEEG